MEKLQLNGVWLHMTCGCGHIFRGGPHLPVWLPVGSKSAAEQSGRSHLCCPSAGYPPGGAKERSSAGHVPACNEPETMATAQRHHLYVSSGWMCICSCLSGCLQTHFYLHAPVRTHNSVTLTHIKKSVKLRNIKHRVGFKLNWHNADWINHADNQMLTQTACRNIAASLM